MSELENQLGQLSVDDDQKDLDVFKDPVAFTESKSQEEIKNTKGSILKFSQRSNSAAKLFELLQENIQRFLRALNMLGDDQASILINTLQLVPSNEKEHVIPQILHTITKVLKNRLDPTPLRFYTQTYLNLVSEFKFVSVSDVQVLLSQIIPENEDVQAVILFIIVKNLESDQSGTMDSISSYFDYKLEVDTASSSFQNLTKCLELLFPLVPMVCAKIYTSNKCKDIINGHISGMTPTSLKVEHNRLLAKGLLSLVSSSCIDDDCRKFNANTYLNLLSVGAHLKEYTDIRLLSALCIIKLWNFLKLGQEKFSVTMDDLYDWNVEFLKSQTENSSDHLEYCIESMAYLTLSGTIKKKIRQDIEVLEKIIALLRSRTALNSLDSSHSAIVYGLLSIISSLMKIQDDYSTQETKTVNYLKSVATPKPGDDVKEDPQDIHNFNKALVLDHKIVELISKLKVIKRDGSSISQNLISVIYYASTQQNKQVRQELVKEGALNIILDYLVSTSVVKEGVTRPISTSKESTIDVRIHALRALAKVLVSVNPALAFNKYSVITCLPFLVELLGPDISKYSGNLTVPKSDQYLYDHITMLDKYESLLALTNISADDKNDIKDNIIAKTFDYLDNFIIDSDNTMVQRASWELVSNLIMKPKMLVRFFNMEDTQSKKRLTLLVKLMDSTDLKLQVILAGMLANATSDFDMIPQLLVENDTGVTELIQTVFATQSTDKDLVLRLSYVLLDLVYAAANLGESHLNKFKDNTDLKTSMAKVIQTKDAEILEVLIEVLKLIA